MSFSTYKHQREPYYDYHIKNIKIILDKEKKEQNNGTLTWEIIEDDLKYDHSEKLVYLYNSLKDENIVIKESYLEVLSKCIIGSEDKYLDSENLVIGNSSVCFFALCKIGHTDLAIISLRHSNNPLTIVKPIEKIIDNGLPYFNNDDLGYILEVLKKIDNVIFTKLETNISILIDKIIDVRYHTLERKLEGIDSEINNDKRKVIEYLKNFSFEKKYNITLNKIDKYIADEEFDDTVTPGGVIGIFREFFNDFYIDLGNKIAEISGEGEIPKIKECEKEICNAVNYIKLKFKLGDDDTKLLKAYLGITNSQGSHKLLSEKKYFRLIRNMGIEVSLLMLSKLEDYKNSIKK